MDILNSESKTNTSNSYLSNVLRLLRIANDLSIKELAEKMGASPTHISEIEANNKKPSLDMLTKYSEALKVDRSAILYFQEEEEKKNYGYQKLLLKILTEITKE